MASRVRTFNNLQEALSSRMRNERVFAQEYPGPFVKSEKQGARKFLVGKSIEIWRAMRSLPIPLRHFHEVIIPGADLGHSPCAAELNACIDEVIRQVEKELGIEVDEEKSVDLNATRNDKCSCHLHLQLSGNQAFRDIKHLRYFVQSILQQPGVSTALRNSVDTAVYYEKKSLRTFLSTKKSSTCSPTPFLPTERFGADSRSQFEVFQTSLICIVDDQLPDDSKLVTKLITWAQPLYYPLHTSEDEEVYAPLTAPIPESSYLQGEQKSSRPIEYTYSSQPVTARKARSYEKDCIARLPKAVQNWFNSLAQGASVAKMKVNFPYEVLVSMSGGFCRKIGRKHKSNRTFYLIDLAVGYAWQKCYDPDCKMFTSEAIRIPDAVQGLLMDSCPESLPELECSGWIQEFFRQSPKRISNRLASICAECTSSDDLNHRASQDPSVLHNAGGGCKITEDSTKTLEDSHLGTRSPIINRTLAGLTSDGESIHISNADLIDLYTWEADPENGGSPSYANESGHLEKRSFTKSYSSIGGNRGMKQHNSTRRPLSELQLPITN